MPYMSTSRMVGGKERTVDEYVGMYDPDTGVVTPKTSTKPRSKYRCIREEMDPSSTSRRPVPGTMAASIYRTTYSAASTSVLTFTVRSVCRRRP